MQQAGAGRQMRLIVARETGLRYEKPPMTSASPMIPIAAGRSAGLALLGLLLSRP